MEKATFAIEVGKLIVEGLKALAWPVATLGLGWMFKPKIEGLLDRLQSAKFPGGELNLREQAAVELQLTRNDLKQATEKLAEAESPDEKRAYAEEIERMTTEIERLTRLEEGLREREKRSGEFIARLMMQRSEMPRYVGPMAAYSEGKLTVMKNLTTALGADWINQRHAAGDDAAILERASDVIERAYDGSAMAGGVPLNGGSMTGIASAGMLDQTRRQLSPLGYLELLRLAKELAPPSSKSD